MKKLYRKIPGLGNKYCVNNEGKVYNLELKRHLVEQCRGNKSFYIIRVNKQTYNYSGMTIRARAFGIGSFKGKEKGEIVYIDIEEENKIC